MPEISPEFQAAFERGRYDVPYFAEHLLGVVLHPGQIRMMDGYIRRDRSGWRALYLWLMVSSGNRAGKTLAVAVIILHTCFYKMGSEPPSSYTDHNLSRWNTRPFAWYHFAVQQEVADIVWQQIAWLFQGINPAQKDGKCPLSDMVGGSKQIATWEPKYHGDYRWVKLSPFFGGADIHFRSTSEAAIGSLGQDINGVSFDEVGFQPTKFDFVINEVLHTRRMGTGGQMVLISTPSEGINEWADLWYTGDPDAPDHKPGRFSMRMSTRENVGYGLDETTFNRMIEDMDEDQIAQNVDGYFVQGSDMYFSAQSVNDCFLDELPEHNDAKPKHLYFQGIDPALRQDSSWSIVCDAVVLPRDRVAQDLTLIGVDARVMTGQQTVDTLMALAIDANHAYARRFVHQETYFGESRCLTAIDATGFGGKLFEQLIRDAIPDVVPISFSGSAARKRKLLGDLRTMIDSGRLLLPRSGIWLRVRRQLLGYKVVDRSIEQDAVMALAVLVALLKRAGPNDQESVRFDWSAPSTSPQRRV